MASSRKSRFNKILFNRRNDAACFFGEMSRQPCVYLLASKRNGTLDTGVASNLIKRVWEHKNHAADGFTKKYQIDRLVRCEVHETMESAIQREKAIKEWRRAWKLGLIGKFNPDWADLYETLC